MEPLSSGVMSVRIAPVLAAEAMGFRERVPPAVLALVLVTVALDVAVRQELSGQEAALPLALWVPVVAPATGWPGSAVEELDWGPVWVEHETVRDA